MPAKNSIKISIENGYYHLYNRGVNKQKIFESPMDYSVFLRYLKDALSPAPKQSELEKFEVEIHGVTFIKPKRPPKNFLGEIDLIAYALMPNHFHLLIRQIKNGAMEAFVKSVATRYSMYFNKAYTRVGPLFQGVYKAVMIQNENYLLHVSRYIHLNPQKIVHNLTDAHSSYADYLGIKHTAWLNPRLVLDYFNNPVHPALQKVHNTYKNFVEAYNPKDPENETMLENLTLD